VNFTHLLRVSLVPFSTAWVADTRLAAAPVSVYGGICAGGLGELRFRVGGEVKEISADAADHANTIVLDVGNIRDGNVTVIKFPLWDFGSVCCVLLVYLWPEAVWFTYEDAGHVETE
jgi:hypothetical protein